VVDGEALLEMLWTASLAGLGVTTVYGIAIAGASRAVDLRRNGRPGEATVFAVIAALALVVVAGAVVFGVVVMTSKD